MCSMLEDFFRLFLVHPVHLLDLSTTLPRKTLGVKMSITLILRASTVNAISPEDIVRKFKIRETLWGIYFQVELTPECTIGTRWFRGRTCYYIILAPEKRTYYLLNQGDGEGDSVIPENQWWREYHS